VSDISLEPLLNSRLVKGPSGPTTNRQVTLVSGTPKKVTPTSGCSAMHIFNNTAVNIRYGGSGVDGSSGVVLFNQSTLVISSPKSDFEIHFFQGSGSDKTLDIVEFF